MGLISSKIPPESAYHSIVPQADHANQAESDIICSIVDYSLNSASDAIVKLLGHADQSLTLA